MTYHLTNAELGNLSYLPGFSEFLSPPPPPQIPSSAVEMPGSADVSGLNVQFGALDFGSEAASGLVDMGQKESSRDPTLAPTALPHPNPVPVAAAQQQQPQSSLFSKPGPMRYHLFHSRTLVYIGTRMQYYISINVKQVFI